MGKWYFPHLKLDKLICTYPWNNSELTGLFNVSFQFLKSKLICIVCLFFVSQVNLILLLCHFHVCFVIY